MSASVSYQVDSYERESTESTITLLSRIRAKVTDKKLPDIRHAFVRETPTSKWSYFIFNSIIAIAATAVRV